MHYIEEKQEVVQLRHPYMLAWQLLLTSAQPLSCDLFYTLSHTHTFPHGNIQRNRPAYLPPFLPDSLPLPLSLPLSLTSVTCSTHCHIPIPSPTETPMNRPTNLPPFLSEVPPVSCKGGRTQDTCQFSKMSFLLVPSLLAVLACGRVVFKILT